METLVLNAYYEPVARVPWTRAITLLYETKQAELENRPYELKVELVKTYEDRRVRSAYEDWAMPSVIRWLKMTPNRKKAVKFTRENVFLRDNGKCQYCGVVLSRDRKAPDCFTYDHIVPRARGGQTTWENVVVCCITCNQRKGNKTPREAGMKLLSVPVKPKKLTESLRLHLNWCVGMPKEWRSYIRNDLYWNDVLENDMI